MLTLDLIYPGNALFAHTLRPKRTLLHCNSNGGLQAEFVHCEVFFVVVCFLIETLEELDISRNIDGWEIRNNIVLKQVHDKMKEGGNRSKD